MTIEIKCQSCGRLTECSTLLLSACPLLHCGWCGTPIERPTPPRKYQSYIEKLKEWIWSDDPDEEAPELGSSTAIQVPAEPKIESLAQCRNWRAAFVAWMDHVLFSPARASNVEYRVRTDPQAIFDGRLLITVEARLQTPRRKWTARACWWADDVERMSPATAQEDVARGMLELGMTLARAAAEDYR